MIEFLDPLGRTIFPYCDDQGRTHVEPAPGQTVCDFCMEPDPTWSFPCGPTPVVGHAFITHSEDDWAACQACYEAIENGAGTREIAEEMVRRMETRKLSSAYTTRPFEEAIELQRRNLEGFLAARTGPPEEVGG